MKALIARTKEWHRGLSTHKFLMLWGLVFLVALYFFIKVALAYPAVVLTVVWGTVVVALLVLLYLIVYQEIKRTRGH